MPPKNVGKLFRNGRSQALRLPREFRFEGDAVIIKRTPDGVLLQPLLPEPALWFAELDRLRSEPFMEKGRRQPPTPRRKIFR